MLMATVLFLEGELMGGLVDLGRVGRETSRGCGGGHQRHDPQHFRSAD
jgi:hypothetical protein